VNELERFLIFVPAAVLFVALAFFLLWRLIMGDADKHAGQHRVMAVAIAKAAMARADVDAKYAELCRKEGAS
jgi:hypothetical protein